MLKWNSKRIFNDLDLNSEININLLSYETMYGTVYIRRVH